ncbi:MAG: ABC transporter ATP-binding protein, partial [Proteobacteria bacterium]|nr:ABC transporter ATP-binding protein [Pseudomonadota bacterium]
VMEKGRIVLASDSAGMLAEPGPVSALLGV